MGRMGTFERHYDEWAAKRNNGEVGIPNDQGLWMIIYSAGTQSDITALKTHSEKLADKWRVQRDGGQLIEISGCPSCSDLEDIINSEIVSTVAFLGHGTLGAVHHYRGLQWENVAWYHFADMSGPLKTGVFEQRTCATIGSDDQVRLPVGTFVMEDPGNVYAPVGQFFVSGSTGFDEFDAAIHPAYQAGSTSNEALLQPISVK